MQKLTIKTETFFENLSALIASGVTFEAEDNDKNDTIEVIFTGGF